MMNKIIAFIESQENISITLDVNGEWKVLNVPLSHENVDSVRVALDNNDGDRVLDLLDIVESVKKYTSSKVEISLDGVFYKGVRLDNSLTKRIIKLKKENQPAQYLINFLNKLLNNPSKSSIDELFDFLAHSNLPITPEGDFLAYKGVGEDYLDCYSRKFDNSIGNIIEMERNLVCDNRNQGCSQGFHAGTYEYARDYAERNNGRVVIVEIDPADAVSVPNDCSCQKLRVCKYKVLKDFEKIMTESVHKAENKNYVEKRVDELRKKKQRKADEIPLEWKKDAKTVTDYVKRLLNFKYDCNIDRVTEKTNVSRDEVIAMVLEDEKLKFLGEDIVYS